MRVFPFLLAGLALPSDEALSSRGRFSNLKIASHLSEVRRRSGIILENYLRLSRTGAFHHALSMHITITSFMKYLLFLIVLTTIGSGSDAQGTWVPLKNPSPDSTAG